MQSLRKTTGKTLAVPTVSRRTAFRSSGVIVRAENKVVREYREDDDQIVKPGEADKKKALYADPNSTDGLFKREKMSKAQQQKLREEYLGWGGSADKPLQTNYFLNIILVISFLAILSAALGYI